MTNYINKMQEQVKEFQSTFGQPCPDKPVALTLERALDRNSWGTGEELVEFLHASSSNQEEFRNSFAKLLGELKVAFKKQESKQFPQTEEERIIAQVDAIVDKLYFTMGDAVEMGVDVSPVFDIVHNANMSKLFTDKETGEKYVKYSDTGKVLKSPEFEPPEENIAEEVKRQISGDDIGITKYKKLKTKKKKEDASIIASQDGLFISGENIIDIVDKQLDINVEGISSRIEE